MKAFQKRIIGIWRIETYERKGKLMKTVQYEITPYSTSSVSLGEMIAEGAIRMIQEKHLKELRILDICCGVGVIGLTIFLNLEKNIDFKNVAFSDINIFNLQSLRKTLQKNNIRKKQFSIYLSDSLMHIPTSEKFDIIVSNPPHFAGGAHPKSRPTTLADELGAYDPDWGFHQSFYRQCHNYLTEKGEIWFLENSSASSEEAFLPFIKANDQLTYIETFKEPLIPHFYWMITRRKP